MHGGGVADATRAVFGGGIGGSTTNTIEYFTIATLGNATDFGDLLLAVARNTACSDTTRGVFVEVQEIIVPLIEIWSI